MRHSVSEKTIDKTKKVVSYMQDSAVLEKIWLSNLTIFYIGEGS